MGETLKSRKVYTPFGILFQIPVFIVAIYGLYNLIERFFYSFTEYDMVGKPAYVGVENYARIFDDEVIRKCFGNTVIMFCIVAGLLIFTAVLPAVFTARLKLPFGLCVMGAFSLISVCSMMSGLFVNLFSGDSYGILNSWLLSRSIINEPIQFTQEYSMTVSIIVLWLYCLAPVFSITYIAARMKHSFLGTAIACCSIPVFMYSGGGFATAVVGYPTVGNKADWLYTVFNDYLTVKYEVGFACAILTVGIALLIVWCALVCLTSFGFWAICKNINSDSDNKAFKVLGIISFAASLLLFAVASIFILLHLLRAFMSLDELVALPNFIPKRPTLQNFADIGMLISKMRVGFSDYLINSLVIVPLVIMPACFLAALPSGLGFGRFNAFKGQRILLLCFIPFLFVSGYLTFNNLGIIDSYLVYAFKFLSSFEFFTALFSVYIAAKLVFYNRKPDVSGILLGVLFILSSFYAAGSIRGIWYYSGGYIFDEKLKLWRDLSAVLAMGGAARSGVVAANDILMLLATIAAVAVPSVLLLLLYHRYRKNTEGQETLNA